MIQINLLASISSGVLIYLLSPPGFPRSIYFIDLILTIGAIITARIAVRAIRDCGVPSAQPRNGVRTVIYGAGEAGEILLHDIRNTPKLPLDTAIWEVWCRNLGTGIRPARTLNGRCASARRSCRPVIRAQT